jgi:hypothetical protein
LLRRVWRRGTRNGNEKKRKRKKRISVGCKVWKELRLARSGPQQELSEILRLVNFLVHGLKRLKIGIRVPDP